MCMIIIFLIALRQHNWNVCGKSAVQIICFEHLSERRHQTILSSRISKYSSFTHISFYKFQINCSTKMNIVLCRPLTTVVWYSVHAMNPFMYSLLFHGSPNSEQHAFSDNGNSQQIKYLSTIGTTVHHGIRKHTRINFLYFK